MKDEKYVNSGIATLDAANITFDDFEMPFPLQKNDSGNWNHRDDKRGWIIFQPLFMYLNGIAYHHRR